MLVAVETVVKVETEKGHTSAAVCHAHFGESVEVPGYSQMQVMVGINKHHAMTGARCWSEVQLSCNDMACWWQGQFRMLMPFENQPSKCHLMRKSITYLGHVVSEHGIKTDPEKTRCVADWPTTLN